MWSCINNTANTWQRSRCDAIRTPPVKTDEKTFYYLIKEHDDNLYLIFWTVLLLISLLQNVMTPFRLFLCNIQIRAFLRIVYVSNCHIGQYYLSLLHSWHLLLKTFCNLRTLYCQRPRQQQNLFYFERFLYITLEEKERWWVLGYLTYSQNWSKTPPAFNIFCTDSS